MQLKHIFLLGAHEDITVAFHTTNLLIQIPKALDHLIYFHKMSQNGTECFLHCPILFRLWPESSLKTMYYRSALYVALKLSTGCQDIHFHLTLKSFALRDTHRKFPSWVLYNYFMNTRKSTSKLRKTYDTFHTWINLMFLITKTLNAVGIWRQIKQWISIQSIWNHRSIDSTNPSGLNSIFH